MKGLRIIPLTMVTAAVLMVVKIADVSRYTEALSEALAQQGSGESPPLPKPDAPDAAANPQTPADIKKAADQSKDDTAKKDEAKPAEKSAEKPAKTEAKEGEGGEKGKVKPNPAVSAEPGDVTERHFSSVEFNLLQNLAKRREDLDRWEENIEIKESALDATEKRIDQKIQQIEAMRQAVADLLAQYNDKEDAKIRSLVKIYENMKPKDAARIFDQMDMPILLLVIDKMSEKKAAPVLAGMDPLKAKQVTEELAEQRKLNTNKLNALNAPMAAPPTPAAPKTASP